MQHSILEDFDPPILFEGQSPQHSVQGESITHPLLDKRPKVELPGDNRPMSDYAREASSHLHDKDLFRKERLVVTLNETNDGIRIVTDQELRTLMENYVLSYRVHRRRDSDDKYTFLKTMSADQSRAVLASPQFIDGLRSIDKVNNVQLPVMRNNGDITLLPQGYDFESQTYTIKQGFDPSITIDGSSYIKELLNEFHFNDDKRSKAVAVSAMLTVFAIGLLPENSLRPCFIYLANAEGAGKTLLANCAIAPVMGRTFCNVWTHRNEDMEKLLTAITLATQTIIFFDNAKGHLDNPAVEAFISASNWEGRILGASKVFTGKNNAVVFITGNGCTVSPDLRRRSLFIELFMEEDKLENRKFKKILNERVLLDCRQKILISLWSIVKAWDNAGRPKASRTHPSFPDWSMIIGGMSEHAGFGSPLINPILKEGGDKDVEDMSLFVKKIYNVHPSKELTFVKLTKLAYHENLFERVFCGEEELDRKGKTTFSRILKRYDRRIFGAERLRFLIQSEGRNRRYIVNRE